MPVENGPAFAQQFFMNISKGFKNAGLVNKAFPNVPSKYIHTIGQEKVANIERNFVPIRSVRGEFVPRKINTCRDAAKR